MPVHSICLKLFLVSLLCADGGSSSHSLVVLLSEKRRENRESRVSRSLTHSRNIIFLPSCLFFLTITASVSPSQVPDSASVLLMKP